MSPEPYERCPTHPHHRWDDCPQCEAKIRRAELDASDDDDPGEADRAADRYERWLGGDAA